MRWNHLNHAGLPLIGRKLLYINVVEQLYPDDDRQARSRLIGCCFSVLLDKFATLGSPDEMGAKGWRVEVV
jgi:hypothetical protein